MVPDEMGYGEPKKPQEFVERWGVRNTDGICYYRDIVHAIGNSDQFPFPLWQKDYKHLAAQEAQTETINAVVAALERVPKYEDQLDPDAISKSALMDHLIGRIEEYGETYGVAEMLLDIREFQIRRKRKE